MKLYALNDTNGSLLFFKIATMFPNNYMEVEYDGDLEYLASNMDLFSVIGDRIVKTKERSEENEVVIYCINNIKSLKVSSSKYPGEITFKMKNISDLDLHINGLRLADYMTYDQHYDVFLFHPILRDYVEVDENDGRIRFSVFEI
jgi:hypothetical protein